MEVFHRVSQASVFFECGFQVSLSGFDLGECFLSVRFEICKSQGTNVILDNLLLNSRCGLILTRGALNAFLFL